MRTRVNAATEWTGAVLNCPPMAEGHYSVQGDGIGQRVPMIDSMTG
jgi:hypothetical protein